MQEPKHEPEIVYGAAKIADAIGESNVRRVYYMLENGHIPGARRWGRRGWALSIPAFRRAVHGEAA